MSSPEEDQPPSDALGDDRPSDNEDALDDTSPQFNVGADDADDSDDESLLSEVDEAQFADFDPEAVAIAPDFETLNKSIKVAKRKHVEGEEPRPKKKKEATREKPKKSRKQRDDSDDGFELGEEVDGKRVRRAKEPGEKKERRRLAVDNDIDEAELSDETKRRRALDRAMDAAIKRPTNRSRRKHGEIVRILSLVAQQISSFSNHGSHRISKQWPTLKLMTFAVA